MFRSNESVLPSWLTLILAIAFVFTGVIVSALFFLTVDAYFNRSFNPLADAAAGVIGIDLDPLPQEGEVTVPAGSSGVISTTMIATTAVDDQSERTNVLLMGIDRRPGGSFISRTDTMLLMSINPSDNSAYILSIPRDFYAVIPGQGRDRINTAFVYGAAGDNPAGGAQLAMQAVEYNLGVPVHHYVLVDFGAVTGGIDAIGGIDVFVPTAISDQTFPDMNYGYDPLFIPSGLQHFDGRTALKYARTRHQDNDFYRAERQQQVIMAVRDKVLNLGLGQMISKAPILYQQLKSGIKTDMSLEEILQLARAAAAISDENIYQEVLDGDYLTPFRTEKGASVQAPMNEKIAPLIQEYFYDS